MTSSLYELEFPTEDELLSLIDLKIHGPNVMKCNPSNINDYCCGSIALIERDITSIFNTNTSKIILDILYDLKILEAFKAREELINYKKVAYHLHQQGVTMERQLAQLSTFFWGEEKEMKIAKEQRTFQDKEEKENDILKGAHGRYWITSERNMELIDTRMQCSGAMIASQDARVLGKHICCIARHPSKKLPKDLGCHVLQGLKSMKIIQESRMHDNGTTDKIDNTDIVGASANNNNNNNNIGAVDTENDIETDNVIDKSSDETNEIGPWLQDFIDMFLLKESDIKATCTSQLYTEEVSKPHVKNTKSPCTTLNNHHLPASWPIYIRRFIVSVVICRGGWKALRIVDEMNNVSNHLKDCIVDAENEVQRLNSFPSYENIMMELNKVSDTSKQSTDSIQDVSSSSMDTSSSTSTSSTSTSTSVIWSPPETSTSSYISSTAADLVSYSLLQRRSLNLLQGCIPHLKDAQYWISTILKQANDNVNKMLQYRLVSNSSNDNIMIKQPIYSERLFVAGENNKIKKHIQSRQKTENAKYLHNNNNKNGENDNNLKMTTKSDLENVEGVKSSFDESQFDIMSPAICAPKGFDGGLKFYELLRKVILKYRPFMQKILSETGWPSHVAERRGLKIESTSTTTAAAAAATEVVANNSVLSMKGNKTIENNSSENKNTNTSTVLPRPMSKVCMICDIQFSKLWVHRGVCCECESNAREGKISPPIDLNQTNQTKNNLLNSTAQDSTSLIISSSRPQGWCPFNTRCKIDWWCYHEKKCIVCDAHSCQQCRLYRGGADVIMELARKLDNAFIDDNEEDNKDNEDNEEDKGNEKLKKMMTNLSSCESSSETCVIEKKRKSHVVDDEESLHGESTTTLTPGAGGADDVENNVLADDDVDNIKNKKDNDNDKKVKPLSLIAFDFDRTLATTRSGGKPLVGIHTLDEDLLTILWNFTNRCCVVTRNKHTEEIIDFLKQNGAPTNIPVHSLLKKYSKATASTFKQVIENEIGNVILVDDTIAELVYDEQMRNCPLIHRVLFVRALL